MPGQRSSGQHDEHAEYEKQHGLHCAEEFPEQHLQRMGQDVDAIGVVTYPVEPANGSCRRRVRTQQPPQQCNAADSDCCRGRLLRYREVSRAARQNCKKNHADNVNAWPLSATSNPRVNLLVNLMGQYRFSDRSSPCQRDSGFRRRRSTVRDLSQVRAPLRRPRRPCRVRQSPDLPAAPVPPAADRDC